MEKPHSPACDRNRDPILAVLRDHFADARRVLEIGSGTGQHAAYFAGHLPQLTWQASDREENLPGIRAWLDDAALPDTPAPLALDVTGNWPEATFDAVFSANTLHIMAWTEVEQLFARLPQVTNAGATLIIYGPFNANGRHSSESNAAFDQSLRLRSAHMGIRDAEAVDALAQRAGFALLADIAMPANNRCRVSRRLDAASVASDGAEAISTLFQTQDFDRKR
jgi:cyclopropane fatty-acyl-phospholipid synthase-like methyltransferase